MAATTTPAAFPLGSLRRVTITLLFVIAILFGALLGVFLASATDLPNLPSVSTLDKYEPNIITQVYAADGSVVGSFAIERRVVVAFKDIPPVLRNAIVAVEDADFWKHLGINPWRVPGALIANFRSGRRQQGFSTLTMQLTRELFLTKEKTLERKIKEMTLAFEIEKNYTKEEIFTLYCNQVYFGHGNYGVQAASQFYFSKSGQDLTLAEAALLAGLPQSPSRLSPLDHPDRALQRRNHVLERMAEEKYITVDELVRARNTPLNLHLHRDPPSVAPYFIEEVRKYLERTYGSQRLYHGGLQVHTTLDPALQRAANRSVRQGLRRLDRHARGFVPFETSLLKDGTLPDPLRLDEWDWPITTDEVVHGVVLASDSGSAQVQIGPYQVLVGRDEIAWTHRSNVAEVLPRGTVAPFLVQSITAEEGRKQIKVRLEQDPKVEGALVAVDPRSGAVRALLGGYDFEKSKFDRATQAMRQVGSAFKPIVYAAALESLGWNPATLISDTPLSFPSANGTWAPHNYDFRFEGPVTLRHALEHSRNIPAIRTLQAVGVDTGIQYARKLGLTGELPPYLPIALGAGEATLMDMVAAYGSFANEGLRMKPMLITQITDRDGNIIEQTRPQARDAVRADTAYIMTSLLKGVVERGTAVRARSLNRPIAGKTGTTDDWTDAWFIGFEPSLVAGVWVGFDEKKLSLGHGQDGAHAALPIWMDFWADVMKDKPMEDFPVPSNIVFVPIDASGRPSAPGAPDVRMEPFVAGTEPRAAMVAAAGED